jgi:hypothetical protein
VGKQNSDHLRNALLQSYELISHCATKVYSGMSFKWDYKSTKCDISMPGYVSNVLRKFQHDAPKHPQHTPSIYAMPVYGSKTGNFGMTSTTRTIREPSHDTSSKHWREKWKKNGHIKELLLILWVIQKQHFDRRYRITDPHYESKKCWETLPRLYLDDTETKRLVNHSDIKQNIGWRTEVG